MTIQLRGVVAAGSLAFALAAFPRGPRIVLAPEGGGGGDPQKDARDAAVELKRVTDEVKRVAEGYQTEVKNLGKASEETKAVADRALAGLTEATKAAEAATRAAEAADTRMTAIEQKMARRGGDEGAVEVKSAGALFVESDQFKSFAATSTRRGAVEVSVERKNITSASATLGATPSVSSSLVQAQRLDLVPLPQQDLPIRALVAPGETSSNAIEFAVQVSRTNNATFVAEGALKPQSDLTFDLRNFPVRTLAHFYKASRQILDDAPALRSIIDAEGRYGLAFVENAALLYGDGTGQNLLGMIPQARAYAAPGGITVAGETRIDRLRLAALNASLALYPASGFVLHPIDWAAIEMTKDGQGRYLVGDPTGQVVPRLWGLPVVTTQAMAQGTFLAGAFRAGAQIFDRMGVEVLLSTEDQDNFVRNMVTIRFEERLAFVVKVPAAFVTGALPNN